MSRKIFLILGLLIALGWFFLGFKLTEIPPGINGDEAQIAYNAMLVFNNGYDQNGKLLPIFISNSEKKDWKQPITFYATVLGFKLFGLSYYVFKGISVFFVIAGGLLIFWLIKEILNVRLAIAGFLLYITTPIIVIQSHLALENIAPVPFVVFWLLMLAKYQKRKKILFLFLAGLTLGISIYSYLGMRLIVPVLILLTLAFILLSTKKIISKAILKAAGIFILGFLPILIITAIIRSQYPGAILAENRPQAINSYQEFLLPYLSTYDISFLFLKGDSTPYHSTGKHGFFLLATLPLFIMGLFITFVRKDRFFVFIVAVFFTIPVLFGLTGTVHRGSRLLSLVPPYILVATLGLNQILSLKSRVLKNLMILFTIIFITLNLYDFISDYWFNYAARVKSYFKSDAHLTLKVLSEQAKKLGKVPIIVWDIYDYEGTAAEFFRQAYFPDYSFQECKQRNCLLVRKFEEDFPANSMLLMPCNKEEKMRKKGFSKLKNITQDYCLVVN